MLDQYPVATLNLNLRQIPNRWRLSVPPCNP
jgi:hypothetical protein